MTVLQACQTAGLRLTGTRPPTVFSTNDRFSAELADLATETAIGIATAHDWQVLTKKHTIPGDGVTTSFALPSDYDRMPIKSNVYSTRSLIAFLPVQDLDRVRHGPAHGVGRAEGNLDVLVKVQPPLSGLQILQVCRRVLGKAAGVVDVVNVH